MAIQSGMRLKFWGVRGSLPSSSTPHQNAQLARKLIEGFFKAGHKTAADVSKYLDSFRVPDIGGYGTATTCVEVQTPEAQIIIDGGSGLRNLSAHLFQGGKPSQKEFHIFLTHFHWDHLIGIPFFTPHFLPGYRINYYAVQPELEEMVKGKFRKPYFPVAFENLRAEINFVSLRPRTAISLGDINITPYLLDHPDPCWGFRMEHKNYAYAHCVDTEGTRSSAGALGPDLPLYQNADLMYFDAQYTLPELAEKASWGHSAAQIGLDIAFREGIDHVIFGHHDPGASTDQINELRKQTKEYYDWRISTAKTNHQQLHHVKWRYGYEGLEVKLSNEE